MEQNWWKVITTLSYVINETQNCFIKILLISNTEQQKHKKVSSMSSGPLDTSGNDEMKLNKFWRANDNCHVSFNDRTTKTTLNIAK